MDEHTEFECEARGVEQSDGAKRWSEAMERSDCASLCLLLAYTPPPPAVTGLSGSGPAYVCMFIEALADGGVASGLTRAQAMGLAVQLVKGAATLVQETGTHPGALKDAVASPGGTTIAGIMELEKAGFRGAVMSAVVAATKRGTELREAEEKNRALANAASLAASRMNIQ